MSTINVALLDDKIVVAQTIIASLNGKYKRINFLGYWGTPEELIIACRRKKLDVLIIDEETIEEDTNRSIHYLKQKLAGVRVVLMTFSRFSIYLNRLKLRKSDSLISNSSNLDELMKSIISSHLGEGNISADLFLIMNRITESDTYSNITRKKEFKSQFTQPESKVFDLLIKGLKNKEIAEQLHRSFRTIEDQRSQILFKTQSNNVAELIAKYHSNFD